VAESPKGRIWAGDQYAPSRFPKRKFSVRTAYFQSDRGCGPAKYGVFGLVRAGVRKGLCKGNSVAHNHSPGRVPGAYLDVGIQPILTIERLEDSATYVLSIGATVFDSTPVED